jgi:hypothetical protein
MRPAVFSAVCLWFAATNAAAQARPPRELTTDRPDRTESPVTVDKAHFQFELELANFADSRVTGGSVRSWGFAVVNAKYGIRDDADLQLIVQGHERTTAGSLTSSSTLPDLTARMKWNLWGDDGGRTAFALMPFITVPREGGAATGGLILPWSTDLGRGWDMGVMSEVDVLARGRVGLVHSATFGHDLTGRLGMYAELASEMPELALKSTAWTGDTGLMYRTGPNLQLDAGIQLGLERAERVRAFVGVSRRY